MSLKYTLPNTYKTFKRNKEISPTMKKYIALLILVLLAGCTAPQVELEEVVNESIIEELPEVIIEEEPIIIEEQEQTGPYYDFYEGDTIEILGHSITLDKIHLNPEISLTVDSTETSIKETKSEEIIENLRILIQEIHDVYQQEKYVTLKVEELNLGENEYIIRKGEKIIIGDKELILEESRTNGYIQVSVYNKGSVMGETESVKRGESLSIYGVTVTNLKNYYKVDQYAWIIAE